MWLMGRSAKTATRVFLVFCAFLLAYELRLSRSLDWWFSDPLGRQVLFWAGLYTGIAALAELVFGDDRASWRFTSLRDTLAIVRSISITTGVFMVVIFLFTRGSLLPRTQLPLTWALSLLALLGVRVASRLGHDPTPLLSLFRTRALHGVPLVLVGGSEKANAFLSAARRESPYEIVAIVSRLKGEKGIVVRGVPVVGDVADLATSGGLKALRIPGAVELLFLEDPLRDLTLAPEDLGALRAQGFKLLRQKRSTEGWGSGGAASELAELSFEDLLARPPIHLDRQSIVALVSGKRAMVTGAGGSIGSEIARQLRIFGCAHLSLIDHSEFNLFEIDRELSTTPLKGGTHRAFLCNLRDAERTQDILMLERPDIVFHAAALKHVTLVEQNPCEGVLTNIGGTLNLVEATARCGAAQMVLISTDKAVAPTSVMGATKRVAEAVLPANGAGKTRYCAVRFGNVLGSTGSVVPIFRDQIERGGPVYVTHPDVERFFMTIPEAVQLVLHASAFSQAGPAQVMRKFALEMGRPVKILDLANQMIRVAGKVPGRDIAIEFIGLRPGEKLTEALVDEAEVGISCGPNIVEINSPDVIAPLPRGKIEELLSCARRGDPDALRAELMETLMDIRGAAAAPSGAQASEKAR